jgi:hypothetical protein
MPTEPRSTPTELRSRATERRPRASAFGSKVTAIAYAERGDS